MEDRYIAHFNPNTEESQSVSSHNLETARLAAERCPLKELRFLAWLAGALHDAGKYRDGFQEYIKKAIENPDRRQEKKTDHSTAGGQIMEQLCSKSMLVEMVQAAVYSHHGLQDLISLEDGKMLFRKRLEKEVDIEAVWERYEKYHDREQLQKELEAATEDMQRLKERIKGFRWESEEEYVDPTGKPVKGKVSYGNRDFCLGMYERVLMSLLIDGDRSDTAAFMRGEAAPGTMDRDERLPLWSSCIAHLERYIGGLPGDTRIDTYRKEISDACLAAAKRPDRLYRLTVPTGAGKTLSGLRFALHHARNHGKRHILYVAPYNSILEQNAEEIRRALGNPEIVLEHHSNVIHEDERSQNQYDRLTENWDSPVIVTTAVQFLDTLFSSKTGCVRRMAALCDSVIVLDEVQALPIRCIQLFNMAVNFLTSFADSTVVLCSATQPLFDHLPKHRLLPPRDMTGEKGRYAEAFRRTTIIDQTERKQGGLSIEELREFIQEIKASAGAGAEAGESSCAGKQILVIVNTKACARKLYEALLEESADGCGIFHLSTNMCAENRSRVLNEIRERLEALDPVICVSTQLIEAGVNLSFGCVIRSLAGLDSVVQAAGRCNRHGRAANGDVYIVRMSPQAEDLSRLRDIRLAQDAMYMVLNLFRNSPEALDGDLSSEKAVTEYYIRYFYARMEEMNYTETAAGISVSLVDLLSSNKIGVEEVKRQTGRKYPHMLKQAFRTAGELFEVIPEDGKVDVVVEYDDHVKEILDQLQNPYLTGRLQRKCLRELQRYTVGISTQMRDRLGNGVNGICEGRVRVLNERYYDKKTGVTETPAAMNFMNY